MQEWCPWNQDHNGGNILELGISKSSLDIQCQRLADGAGLFGPVEDGNLLHAVRDSGEECLGAERSVQADFDDADLLALGCEIIDGLFNSLVDGTHSDDDLLGIGSAVVVEELVVCADLGIDFVHVLLDDRGHCMYSWTIAGIAS